MKASRFFPILLTLILSGMLAPVWAMPPHPELLQRIQSGTAAVPYALQHEDQIRARGVDTPSRVSTIEFLNRWALDENLNLIVLLTDFSDNPAHVPPSFFDTLLYGNRVGTLRDYYDEVSFGNLTLVTLNLPSALGWLRMPETYAYYVDSSNGFGQYPRNAQGLTHDAVLLADTFVNYSNYDFDGDGTVDGLFMIHSGPGAEYTGNDNDIWSHAWSLPTPLRLDNVQIRGYCMMPEYWQYYGDMTCGVFAHEMGHSVFGLPDFYDYGYDSDGLGDWSLMAGGSWNGHDGDSPSHPDAYSRIRMGFTIPTIVSTNMVGVSIPSIETSSVIFQLWRDGMIGNEYFLVENRQRTGYDAALPGEGLLIYHIDEWMDGNDHQWYPGHMTGLHYEAALEQADGRWDMEQNFNQGDATDPYPGPSGDCSFTNGSSPNSQSYGHAATRVTVRNISASADTMTADLAVTYGLNNVTFVRLPDVSAASGDTLFLPVEIDSMTGLNITSFHLEITLDSTIAAFFDPFMDLTGTLIPPSWNVTQTHSMGRIVLNGSGTQALSGEGSLLRIVMRILPDAPEFSVCPLRFAEAAFNQGVPASDPIHGSITIAITHLMVQPQALQFGDVRIGDDLYRILSLRNTGSSPMSVFAVSAPVDFTTNFSGPISIEPGTWSLVRVYFTPTLEQIYQDTLIVYSNAVENPTYIPMTGRGTPSSGVEDQSGSLPTRFALKQNYPNPFNPTTAISFDLPRNSGVALRIYNVNGREAATLIDGNLAAGSHTVAWNAAGFSTGLYIAVLEAGDIRLTQKMLLLK
ncbi:M6 family metalloprotease domain-containing protein [candidate division KSB1 bacterium]|nr:MAG: M6 family metalloprotease domain-containing protein [candidate division KSB1 bacterium]